MFVVISLASAVQGMQAITSFHKIARCSASRSGLQQRRVIAAAMAFTCTGSGLRSRPGTAKPARPGLVQGSPCNAAAPARRCVSAAATKHAHSPFRSRRMDFSLLPGRPARLPDRRLAVASAKKISQQEFTEKAWQAVVAAPQV